MVGVPGRSKGCITCLRRKKGCDKATPSCSNCLRLGLKCEGYGRKLIWLAGSSKECHGSAENTENRGGSSRSTAGIQAPWRVRYAKDPDDQKQIVLHEPLARSARERLYAGRFCSASVPFGRQYCERAIGLTSNAWSRYIAVLYNTEATLRYTTLAISTAMLGVQSRDGQLLRKGMEAYGRALQEMRMALSDPYRHKSDGVLAAARLMQLYELFFGNAKGWREQVRGNVALFVSRGPEAFRTGEAHEFFVDGRILAIMFAIGQRTPTPFASPTWRTVPWQECAKPAKDTLIDALCCITAILAKSDTLKSCGCSSQAERLQRELLADCHHVESALSLWAECEGAEIRKFDYTTQTPLPRPTSDTDFAILHMASTYWIACLLLYTTIESVSTPTNTRGQYPSLCTAHGAGRFHCPISRIVSDSVAAGPASPRMGSVLFAKKIARSIHLFFDPCAGIVQGASALFPLTIALRYFAMTEEQGQSSEEAQILYSLYHRPFMGTYVGRFLQDLHDDVKLQHINNAWQVETMRSNDKIWWYAIMLSKDGQGSP